MQKAELIDYKEALQSLGEWAYLNHLAAKLRGGAVLIMPSDTIYGFMFTTACEAKVREAKRRDSKPFLYLIDSLPRLEEMDIDYEQYRPLLEKNWPGPFTFLLTNRQGEKLGVRLPANPQIRELVKLAGEPLMSTSVNYSGEATLLDVDEIIAEFGDKCDLIVVDREHDGATSSAVVDYDGERYTVIREGSKELVC